MQDKCNESSTNICEIIQELWPNCRKVFLVIPEPDFDCKLTKIPGGASWGEPWSLLCAGVSASNKQASVNSALPLGKYRNTVSVQLLLLVLITLLNSLRVHTPSASTQRCIVCFKDKCRSCASCWLLWAAHCQPHPAGQCTRGWKSLTWGPPAICCWILPWKLSAAVLMPL